MVIARNSSPVATPSLTGPTIFRPTLDLPTSGAELRSYNASAREHAIQLACLSPVAAQAGPNPLASIPTSWVANGTSSRPYRAYLAGLPVPGAAGNASVTRNADGITITSPHGDMSLTRGEGNTVVATGPDGSRYTGTMSTNRNGSVTWTSTDGRQSMTMRHNRGGLLSREHLSITSSGFGVPPGGELCIYP